ncbi:hypothetical protein [uncultured Paraglaciecola sp.]|uniref:hypothetical protein n=1 Tax=uncultured Paraglaciecola sp. TaxID=1765024 RepID=UPI002630B6E6|nr:hypothetical protein [uncultured Paraglaciecola sp.]
MFDYIHPDYEPAEQPIIDLVEESDLLHRRTCESVLDVEYNDDESRQWLGTYEINGQRCQLQLVMTNIDSHFTDEC